MKKKQRTSTLVAVAAATMVVAPAARGAAQSDLAPGPQIQRLQQQRIDAVRELNPRPDVLAPADARSAATDDARPPADDPCFPIERLVLLDNAFDWLARVLQPMVGQVPAGVSSSVRAERAPFGASPDGTSIGACIGKHALKRIQDAANNALVARGYVTSRVLVPPQSLESGTLTLQVVPGRIGDVAADARSIGWLRAALPTSAGALLNQRDLDQGLENLRRLQSQADATFDIAPGARPGESTLVLHAGTGKRWHAVIGADNAGMDSTGRHTLSGSLTLDSPLHLYDQLQIAGTTNANAGAADHGNRSISANYSVPLGHALMTLAASRSRYRQTVAGFGAPIEYGGVQSQLQAGLSGVIHRNAHARTEIRGNLFHKISRNAIDGIDIPVQHRDVIGYELGLSHRRYVGDAVLDGSLAWRASLPGLSNRHGNVVGAPDFDGRTRMEMASLGVQAPFRLGGHAFSYRVDWNAQHARTPLTPADYFTIGTRYAVRGFDQQLTLAAESGWTLSNELDWYVPTPIGAQALYAGVDAGRVRGPAAQELLGETLVGAVVGVRGSLAPKNPLGAALSYDVSLGWPLKKPAGFASGSPTVLFQVNTLF